MKSIFKKLCAYSLIGSLFLSSTVHADTYESNQSASMLITTIVASKWEVSVPSATSFSTVDKQATYEISIAGDVADDSILQVIPESTVDLINDSSDEVIELTVTQTQQSWLGSNISDTPVTATGTITADENAEFGAGQWQGELNFDIICIEEENLTQQIYDTMHSLTLYGAGDSLMEGYGNNYEGVLDTLKTNYGANIGKDYSISGAMITKAGTNGIPDIQSQTTSAIGRLSVEGYTDKSVFIFDGGANDLFAMGEGADITLAEWGDPNKDISTAFLNIWYALSDVQTQASVEAPIVYIIPKFNGIEDTNNALQFTMKTLVETSINDDRFIVIDCNELFTEADISEDTVHWKASGYRKVSKAIALALYDYYNN